jgi:hypothetical protein
MNKFAALALFGYAAGAGLTPAAVEGVDAATQLELEIAAKCPTLTGDALTKAVADSDACGACKADATGADCTKFLEDVMNAFNCYKADDAGNQMGTCILKANKETADAAADKEAADKLAADAKKAAALAGCPTDKAKCRTADSYCATWTKDNQCTTNPEWMIPNCSGTCCPLCNGEADKVAEATCPTDKQTASCKTDSRTSCAKWAENGECTKNAKWMVPNCMASCCDTCTRASDGCPVVKKLCSDDYEVTAEDQGKCAAWAAKGECTKNPRFMNKNCSKSCCSLCQPKAPAKTTTTVATSAFPSYNFGSTYNPYGSYAGFGTQYGTLGAGAYNTGFYGR